MKLSQGLTSLERLGVVLVVPHLTVLIALPVLLMICSPASGQSTAVLQGRVLDEVNDVIVGARITVLNRATSFEWNAETDSQGNYQLVALTVGTYRVAIQASGFQGQR